MIGSIILLVLAILSFFGVLDDLCEKIGCKSIFMFCAVLIFAVSYAIAPIYFFETISISIVGFVFPFIAMILVLIPIVRKKLLMRTFAGAVCLVGVYITIKLSFDLLGYSSILFIALGGVLFGIVAFIVCFEPICIIFTTFFGVVVGEIVTAIIEFTSFEASESLVFGSKISFDFLAVSLCISFIIFYVYAALNKSANARHITNTNLNMEVSSDEGFGLSGEKRDEKPESERDSNMSFLDFLD